MQEHVKFAKEMQVPKTLLIENGDIIKLLPGKVPEIIDKAPSGRIYLEENKMSSFLPQPSLSCILFEIL